MFDLHALQYIRRYEHTVFRHTRSIRRADIRRKIKDQKLITRSVRFRRYLISFREREREPKPSRSCSMILKFFVHYGRVRSKNSV